MAEGNWSVIRVEKISAEGAQKTERHNERKNESYANLNVDTERIARNVHFKDTGGLTYNEYFQRLIDEGKISTRGQKAGATIFNELVIDVNTRYFEEHGGYEYAKQFYEEAYRFGCEIYGEDNIVSAVMHADEINKAVSEELGKPVYHYHLHIVAIPTVRKEILWSKRCKDEALRGTVKEVINQVSHSKKWKNTVPLLDENGQQLISKYGKPMFRKSYSVLQDKLFEHMTEAGFSGFERGVLGSTAENLSSLDYQIQKDKERLADIQERIEAEQVRYEPAHEVHKTMAEIEGICDAFGGECIEISATSKHHINAMDINMNYGDGQNPVTLKSEFMLSLCEQAVSSLGPKQKSLIDRCTASVLNEYMLGGFSGKAPTLKDFNESLKKQPEPEAKDISLALELFTSGSLDTFANETNVDAGNRLVCYDIHDLGKQLMPIGMLVVLDNILNRITANKEKGRRTYIFIDEIYLLFKHEYSANFLFTLWKRVRKYGAYITGITQNVEDLLQSHTARTMLANSELVVMLNQAATDRDELAELMGISELQMSYITNVDCGHGLVKIGGALVPFVNRVPKDTRLYELMTTKPGE